MTLVFANALTTSFSYTFFDLLYKNYVVVNFEKLPAFGNVVTQFYLNFLNFPCLGVILSTYILGRYFTLSMQIGPGLFLEKLLGRWGF